MSQPEIKQVVVLGSGFGALHALLRLAELEKKYPDTKFRVVVISENDYFWLVTMAHEVATGNLMPSGIKQPLRSLKQNIYDDYIRATVKEINLSEHKVSYYLHSPIETSLKVEQEITYDYLISALGSETNFFGVEGAEQFSFPIKTLDDVRALKNQVLRCFESAECLTDKETIRNLLTFVIVGAGPTGVELAGELADLINTVLKDRYTLIQPYARVVLVNAAAEISVPGEEWMGPFISKYLQAKRCVEIKNNFKVTRVTASGAWAGEELVASRSVIWSAGVKGRAIQFVPNNLERNKANRLIVSRRLHLPEHSEVYIVGDQAAIPDGEGGFYPMRAQFAVREGRYAAQSIYATELGQPLSEFSYQDKGVIISLGRGAAVASIFGLRLHGKLAYVLYRLVYLPQIMGWRARIKTALDWFLNMFLPRDLSEL